MDAFLEDGSHEATIAVIRALVVAVPHTTDRLRDYILYLTLCWSYFSRTIYYNCNRVALWLPILAFY